MNAVTFSTLACPDWSLSTIIARAAAFGYDGIEWRGGSRGHIQPDMPPALKTALRQMCSSAGLSTLAVTTYTSFVSHTAEERRANVHELQRYSDLAAELGASYVRAFLGEIPDGTEPDGSVYANIADCLYAACEYASSNGITIAIEPHDSFAHSSAVVPVFRQLSSHPALRVIWDIGNAFAAGEDPDEGFALLKDHLAYIQVKDGKGRGAAWQLCPLGEGDVPLRRAFKLLSAHHYHGAFSVEWEYAWHPELDPPEIALPTALERVRKLLVEVESNPAPP